MCHEHALSLGQTDNSKHEKEFVRGTDKQWDETMRGETSINAQTLHINNMSEKLKGTPQSISVHALTKT